MFRFRVLLSSLWVGSLWTVGYLVAPTLFATIADRVLAGTIAGSMFHVEAWLSLACGVALLGAGAIIKGADESKQRRQVSGLIVAMLACTLIGYFGLHPWMAALKTGMDASGVGASGPAAQFAWLHGIASVIYLLQSLLGIALLLKLR